MSKNFKGWREFKKQPPDYSKYRFLIGIDSGTNTGFAVWDRKEKRLIKLATMKIHQALFDVKCSVEWQGVVSDDLWFVRVEDARLKHWFDKKGDDAQSRAQGVGSVRRDAAIWEDALTEWKIDFELVKPGVTKMDAEQFKKITGWTARCSNHARDAALLVFGY